MTGQGLTHGHTRQKVLVFALVVLCAALFVGANVHLFYVAFASQPECVDHFRSGDAGPGDHIAARSAC